MKLICVLPNIQYWNHETQPASIRCWFGCPASETPPFIFTMINALDDRHIFIIWWQSRKARSLMFPKIYMGALYPLYFQDWAHENTFSHVKHCIFLRRKTNLIFLFQRRRARAWLLCGDWHAGQLKLEHRQTHPQGSPSHPHRHLDQHKDQILTFMLFGRHSQRSKNHRLTIIRQSFNYRLTIVIICRNLRPWVLELPDKDPLVSRSSASHPNFKL